MVFNLGMLWGFHGKVSCRLSDALLSMTLQESLNGLQARYDELKRGRIEEVEAVLEANRRAASNKVSSLEAACQGWKDEAHRQQQRVESLNPEGFRSQMLQ